MKQLKITLLLLLIAGISCAQFAVKPELQTGKAFFVSGCIRFDNKILRDSVHAYIEALIGKPEGKMHRVYKGDFPESGIYDIKYRIKTSTYSVIQDMTTKLEQIRIDSKVLYISAGILSFNSTDYSKVEVYDELKK